MYSSPRVRAALALLSRAAKQQRVLRPSLHAAPLSTAAAAAAPPLWTPPAASAAVNQQQEHQQQPKQRRVLFGAAAAATSLHAPTLAPFRRARTASVSTEAAAAAAATATASSPARAQPPKTEPQQPAKQRQEPPEKEDYSHLPEYTLAEVAKHEDYDSAWLAVDGLVYDATAYLQEHPGGADVIVLNAGTDASDEFRAAHSPPSEARAVLRRFVIGRLAAEEDGQEAARAAAEAAAAERAAEGGVPGAALDPRRRVAFPLVSREWVSPTSVMLRFALPGGPGQRAGLPVGQHVMVYYRDDKADGKADGERGESGASAGESASASASAGEGGGKLVARAYTPVSRDADAGHLDLLVRVYRPNAQFPRGGRLSQLLADAVALEKGEGGGGNGGGGRGMTAGASSSPSILPRVEFKGPVGHFRYLGAGMFSLAGAPPRKASKLTLVAGGSGITPCFQVLRAALEERAAGVAGAPSVALVYGSPSPAEILLRGELDALAAAHPPPAFRLHYTVDRLAGPGEGAEGAASAEGGSAWARAGGSVGFVTREMLEAHGFSGADAEDGAEGERLALVCGPPVMLERAVVPALRAMGYSGDRLVAF